MRADVGVALAAVFGFFKDPRNLGALTPPWHRRRNPNQPAPPDHQAVMR